MLYVAGPTKTLTLAQNTKCGTKKRGHKKDSYRINPYGHPNVKEVNTLLEDCAF